MNPAAAKALSDARERLKQVDPTRDQQTLTDLRYAVERVCDAVEEEGIGRFTARVLADGVVVIPKQIRALRGIRPNDYVTLDLLEVATPDPQ